MKFHSSVKSLSLCSSGSGENKSVALAVSEVKPPPPPEWEVRSRSILVKSGRPPRRGTFLRVQRITETLATHTLSSWPASAISVSLQLTAHIVCRISSGGTSPTGPQRDLTATGPDANPAQHVLYRQTKWLLMIIQVSHIPAGERLELHSKEHLSGGAEECGAWVAKTDQEPFFFFPQLCCRKYMISILKVSWSSWDQPHTVVWWLNYKSFSLFMKIFLCYIQRHQSDVS